ncbi:chitinase-3-like protein 1 [Dermacentor albipictus]|uniref:chitinase-3-like protein 1 n=1 Tax=Dermacentor albipictus TaxID=60249 RepID=UPI0031FC8325
MEDSTTDDVTYRAQRNAARGAAEQESTLRYRLRHQNFCLAVLLFVAILTVTSACGAIVYAVVEHFWTSLEDVDQTTPSADSGASPAGGSRLVFGSPAAEVVMQRLPHAKETSGGVVFCFVNHSVSSGSPHRFYVDNATAALCDALVFVSVALLPAVSGLAFRRPTRDAEALQVLVSLAGSSSAAWACVGGESSDSGDFEWLMAERKSRAAFVHNAAAWSRRVGVAGLLLYWKYPPRQSRSVYNTFVNTMRNAFERDSLRLSVVVPWATTARLDGYDVRSLYGHLDFVVVDTHRTVDPRTFPVTTCQTPMRAAFRARHHGQAGLSSVLDDLSMDAEHFLGKTVLSVSLSAVTFTLRRPWVRRARPGMSAAGPGRPFGRTNQPGLASYYDVARALSQNASWRRETHAFSRCSLVRLGDQWLGVEDRGSLRSKKSAVRRTAGLAVWDLPMDDFAGELGTAWPLLRAAHEVVHG